MKAIIAKKIGMSQIFSSEGDAKPVTLFLVKPNFYIGGGIIGIKASKRISKSIMGKLKKIGIDEPINKFKKFRLLDDEPKVGEKYLTETFTRGDKIYVQAKTKGKGFAGTIKRHGFSRGPVSHGSNNIRQPGSIGAQQPQRVVKGKKMAGHMGAQRRTIKGLEVLDIDSKNQILAVSGSVPGPNKGWVYIWQN